MGGCAAPNCTNSDKKGFKLYCFPSEEKRRQRWLINSRRDNWKPTKCSRLCTEHFEESQFESSRADGWKKLKPNAIPTIFNVPNPPPKFELKRKKQTKNDLSKLVENNTCQNVIQEANENSIGEISVDKKRIKELTARNIILQRKLRKFSVKYNKTTKNLAKFLLPEQIDTLGVDRKSIAAWSNESIIRSLKLRFALGKNGYLYLHSTGYPCPSYSTLNRKIQHLNMEFGLFTKLIPLMKAKVSAMKVLERDCILCIDEMQIQQETCFDPCSKRFYGHISLGDSNKVGNHITCILLRGLNTNWKQIISCDVTGSSTMGNDSFTRIKEVITAANSVNLNICGIVSDMGSNNKALWQKMGVKVTRNNRVTSFHCPNSNIHVFADVQHLLKNLKSAILNGLIHIDGKTAAAEELPSGIVTGSYIRDLWESDKKNSSGLRLLHHLQPSDLYPDHFSKMKVGAAIRFFSVTTAAALESAVRMKLLNVDALTTAWFIRLIFTWHSIVSSRSRKVSITARNVEHKIHFLENFINIIQLANIGAGGWKPLNTGLILSTLSFINLSKYLFSRNYSFLLGSRLTQDALENVFSQVRKRAGKRPNSLECKRILKLLVVSQFISDINQTNYCSDTDIHLINAITTETNAQEVICVADDDNLNISMLDKNNLYYIAGSVVKRLLKQTINICPICSEFLSGSGDTVDSSSKFLTEYSNLGGLKMAPNSLFQIIMECENVFINNKGEFLCGNISVCDTAIISKIIQKCSDVCIPNCCDLKFKIIKDFLLTRSISYAKYMNIQDDCTPILRGSASFC